MSDNGIIVYEPIDKEKIKTQIFEIRGYKVGIQNMHLLFIRKQV